MKRKIFAIIILLIVLTIMGSIFSVNVNAQGQVFQASESVPTVTGTPIRSWITVRMDDDMPQINVRSGPGTNYDGIGVLQMGEKATALGRTAGGDWILIEYFGVDGNQGWVYTSLVIPEGETLPIIVPPATPTPLVTATIDPTLAAQFIVTNAPTRLPTYTEPAPLTIPTFEEVVSRSAIGSIPIGLIILVLIVFGGVLGLITVLQNR